MKNFRTKTGFTLAEVLITLAIIGVVAALTIPSVVQNYKKTQTVTQLKKTYSAIANTTNLAIADNGPITGWEVENNNAGGTGVGSQKFADKYIIPYLKIAKNCGTKTTGECKFGYTYLNKSLSTNLDAAYSRFYLNDGTLIGVITWNVIGGEGLPQRYAQIYIDVNGQKPPNTWGKDIFRFEYYVFVNTQENAGNGKLIPTGYNWSIESLTKDGETWNCNKGANGSACGALIMKQGWQMKDDYPW